MIYRLIRQTNYEDFNLVINNFLKDEWEFYGDTQIRIEKVAPNELDKNALVDMIVYYQAMIK